MGPIREMLAQSGISEQKWRVLRVLDERGPLEQKAIAEDACLLLPSLTRIMQAMEAEGLVTRALSPEDRRRTIVTISPAGKTLIARHAVESNAILEQLETAYGTERLAELLQLLEELRQIDLDRG